MFLGLFGVLRVPLSTPEKISQVHQPLTLPLSKKRGECAGIGSVRRAARNVGSRRTAKIFASAILLFAEWALEPPKKAEKDAKIHTNIAHKVRAG